MKKNYVLFITILFCAFGYAQFSFPAAGPVITLDATTPVIVPINDVANAAGVTPGTYFDFTVTCNWVNLDDAWSSEERLSVVTSAGASTSIAPSNGANNTTSVNGLTFSGAMFEPYDPNTNGFLELSLTRTFNSDAQLSNIVVTIMGPTTVDCSQSGINDGFCHGNNEAFNLGYSASEISKQLAITFNAGSLEEEGAGTYDDLIIYDGINNSSAVLFNSDIDGGGDLAGLSLLAASGTIFIEFDSDVSISCADGDETTIDYDVTCVDPAPCPVPTGLSVDDFTGNTANISWNAGIASTWEIAVQTAGTGVPIGAGTSVATNSYFDDSLSPSTAYEVYLRADCTSTSDGFSNWVGPVNFTTTSIPVPIGLSCISGSSTIIFTEEFNSVGSWTGNFNGPNNATGTWELPGDASSIGTGPSSAFSGVNYMNYEASFATNVGSTSTASAVSPAIDLTSVVEDAELSFYMHAFGAAMGTLNVGISTSGSAGPFTIVFTQDGQLQTSETDPWVAVGINLSTYLGNTIHIEFSHTGAGGAANTFTGDMSIDYLRIEACDTPIPVTYTYNNGWDTDPNGVATLADAINVVAGEATINTNTKGNTLTINPTGSLVLNTGITLELNGSLEMESISDQYSSLISKGTILGTVNYKRHVNTFATNVITGNNDLISAPVTNASQTFSAFIANPDNLNIPSGTIEGVPSFLFGPFDRDNNTYTNYNVSNFLDQLQAGIGYRTASTAPSGSTLSFTGDVLTGIVPVNISIGTLSEWNLIGNPYTSYINSGNFLTANAAFLNEDAIGIYGYDGTAQNGWTIINFNTMNTAKNITPGQGFLVAAEGTATLNFTPAMRRNIGSDDFIDGRSNMDTNHYLKLNVNNASSNYHTDFYFNDNSSRDLDPGYDAKLFNATLPSLYMYSHLVDNNEGVSMAIQSLATTDLTDVIIPLGINANQGEQLTISIAESTLPDNVDVYLEDTVTNIFTLLNTTEYVFTPSTSLIGTGRFFLRYTAETLSTSEDNFETVQIYTTTSPKTLFIKGILQNETRLEIYDIQGRMILKSKLDTRSNFNEIDISEITTGVYIVKLNNGNSQKSQKVIIN